MKHLRSIIKQLLKSSQLLSLVIQLSWKAAPLLISALLILIVLQAALPVAELQLAKIVVDRVAQELGVAGSAAPAPEGPPLVVWIIVTAVILVLGQTVQPFVTTLQMLAADRVTGYVTSELIRVANTWQGLLRFEDPSFADDLERARTRAASGGLNLMREATYGGISLLTAVYLIWALLGLHVLAPFLILLFSLPLMFTQWNYMRATGNHLYIQTPESRRLQYWRQTVLTPEPAKDVRLYDLVPLFRRRYDESFERSIGTLDRLRYRLTLRVMAASAISVVAVAAVYIYTIWTIVMDGSPVGDLVLYGGAATMLQAQVLSLGNSLGVLPSDFDFIPSIHRVLKAPPDLPTAVHTTPVPRRINQGIRFENVHFAYPGTTEPVLCGVSLSLRPAQSLALVGKNGAGKTTLVKLLLRLYDPTAGRILIDGVDIRDFNPDDLRREIGVIFQDYVRYELTAGENIGVGQVDVLGHRDVLLRAAEKAGATELLASLPEGLETVLGREFGGRELSGGEWQKLALSRAFVRECQILVLDEPTAALDVQTEYDIYTRFHDLTRDRTALLISHRFSTVRMADRIVYLDKGRVQEEGTHEELMKHGGGYSRLYKLQASHYADLSADCEDR